MLVQLHIVVESGKGGGAGGALYKNSNIGAYSPFARILIYAAPTSWIDVDQS